MQHLTRISSKVLAMLGVQSLICALIVFIHGANYGCLRTSIWLFFGLFSIGVILLKVSPIYTNGDFEALCEMYRVDKEAKHSYGFMLFTVVCLLVLYTSLPISSAQWEGFENVLAASYHATVQTLALWRALPTWYTVQMAYPILNSLGEHVIFGSYFPAFMRAWTVVYFIFLYLFSKAWLQYCIYKKKGVL